MKFVATPLAGLYLIELEAMVDERGSFARTFCAHEFEKVGLDARVAQCNASFNTCAGTLRGLHFQAPPHEESKLVRCTRGAIYDVAVDIRPASPTYLQWYAAELTFTNSRMLFVPAGFAHGFQTLADATEVSYVMSEFYHPDSGRGLRWNDPALGIAWPIGDPIMSEKDSLFPLIERPAR